MTLGNYVNCPVTSHESIAERSLEPLSCAITFSWLPGYRHPFRLWNVYRVVRRNYATSRLTCYLLLSKMSTLPLSISWLPLFPERHISGCFYSVRLTHIFGCLCTEWIENKNPFERLGTLGVVSGVAVFYWPKLQLPDTPDFKVFTDDHPFEIYDSQFKNMFWFEKTYTVNDLTQSQFVRRLWLRHLTFL